MAKFVYCRYYLNGVDAFRLKLLLPLTQQRQDEIAAQELQQLSMSNGAPGPSGNSAESSDAMNEQEQQSQQAQREQHQEADLKVKKADVQNETNDSKSDQTQDLLHRLAALQT